MTDDRNREEPRVSRSGRILKKTLKMKEMEDIEEDRQEKGRRRLVHHPMYCELEVKQSASRIFAHDTTESSSSGSLTLSSTDISGGDALFSKPKTKSKVAPSFQKTSKELHGMNHVYSSDGDRAWSTDVSSEDDSISNGSFDKSSEGFDDHPKQQEFGMIPKRVCEKVQEYPTAKRKGKRKPFTVPKIRSTQIKTAKGASAASRRFFNSYSQRKMDGIEDINKKLIFSELTKRLGGTYLSLQQNSVSGKVEQPSSLQSLNSSDTKCNEKTKSARDEKRVNSQKQEQPLELFESNPTLGIAPIDVAAHLKLLGDNLTKIGMAVANLNHIGPGVYSSLLDMLLCSVGPMLCLTRDVTGLERLPEDVFVKILDHIAYIIPGL